MCESTSITAACGITNELSSTQMNWNAATTIKATTATTTNDKERKINTTWNT